MAAGASGYVVKSTSAAQLSDAMRSVTSGHTVIDPQLAAAALRSYRSTIMTKMDVTIRVQAVAAARGNGRL